MYIQSATANESLLGSPVSGADAKASERSGLSRSGGTLSVPPGFLSRKQCPSASSSSLDGAAHINDGVS